MDGLKNTVQHFLQMLTALLFMSILFAFVNFGWILLIAWFYVNAYWKAFIIIAIIYNVYDHTVNYSKVNSLGAVSMILRNNLIWKNFRAYFPIELVKTAELPANQNYILASFPHGVVCIGGTINFCYDISKWLELFPGIRPNLGTLNHHFYIPLLRDWVRYNGWISASKKSLMYHLHATPNNKNEKNNDGFTASAVSIVVGGAQEALDSQPGHYRLTLKQRKGFVKLAIQTGCAIVPVFSFGEVDIFHQIEHPLVRRCQLIMKKLTGVSPVLLKGSNLLPLRKRIVQVVGAPIQVQQSDKPNAVYIDEVHTKFIIELTKLFEEQKEKYIANAKNTTLVIQ